MSSRRVDSWGAGVPPARTTVGLRSTAGGTPALPGTPPLGAFPGSAGSLPASTHRWACGPLAGGTPALPGEPHAKSWLDVEDDDA